MNEQQFDRYLHINTIGEQYGYPKLAHYHRYEPTPYTGLEQLFAQYELPPQSTFIDMGCGKGRVPIYVHEKFHIPTIGVEMDAKFFIEAEHNKSCYLQKAKNRMQDITFLHLLAEQYEVQKTDNVFFFFNPFSIQIFRKVVKNILQSYEEYEREIHIILYYPSQDYLQYLVYETLFDLVLEIPLERESNINERLCVFQLKQA